MATTFGKYIIEFLPIILIYLLVTYTNMMVRLSHTILGKIFAVLLIIFYSTIDEIHGAIVCILVIYYYQSDYVEGMATLLNEVPPIPHVPLTEGYKDDSDSDSDSDSDDDEEDNKKKKKRRKKKRRDRDEGFELLEDAYPKTESLSKMPSPLEESKYDFQKKYCKNGHLIFQEHRVKTEMTEHVFPEIKYNAERCNLCDPTCDYSIVETKMVTEETLRPKDSNDWVDHVWKTMTEFYNFSA
jgi:hypothetical protein